MPRPRKPHPYCRRCKEVLHGHEIRCPRCERWIVSKRTVSLMAIIFVAFLGLLQYWEKIETVLGSTFTD